MRNTHCTMAAVHVPGETYTPHEYAMASQALSRVGWTCTSGIYPNPTAEAGQPVRWQGHFERVQNGKTERFCLTPKTIGTPEFQSAAAFAPSASVEKELRRDLAGMDREAPRLREINAALLEALRAMLVQFDCRLYKDQFGIGSGEDRAIVAARAAVRAAT